MGAVPAHEEVSSELKMPEKEFNGNFASVLSLDEILRQTSWLSGNKLDSQAPVSPGVLKSPHLQSPKGRKKTKRISAPVQLEDEFHSAVTCEETVVVEESGSKVVDKSCENFTDAQSEPFTVSCIETKNNAKEKYNSRRQTVEARRKATNGIERKKFQTAPDLSISVSSFGSMSPKTPLSPHRGKTAKLKKPDGAVERYDLCSVLSNPPVYDKCADDIMCGFDPSVILLIDRSLGDNEMIPSQAALLSHLLGVDDSSAALPKSPVSQACIGQCSTRKVSSLLQRRLGDCNSAPAVLSSIGTSRRQERDQYQTNSSHKFMSN
jgi:hypothetical protein